MPGSPPNVVFVLTDDQGYGDLGCHGNPILRTPHLDRLHAESVRLTDFHVGPTCSPTRAGLLTGHYANSTGVWHTIAGRSSLRRDERTLAERLAGAGYATGLFGKWHLGDAFPYRPQDRGFDEVVTHGGGGVGNTPDYWGNAYTDDVYCRNGEWQRFDGYCTSVWFRLARDFIARHRDRPFFCLVTPNAPHLPHIVPERYSDPYFELARDDPAAGAFFGYPASDQMPRFYGMVACVDEEVGRLRGALADLDLERDTLFVFMTDNGSAGGLTCDGAGFVVHGHNAGMRGKKGSPYEGGHRVPLFLHWPGGALGAPRDVATLAANVDVAPTLLDLCGVPFAPAEFHGRSLLPLLRPGSPAGGALSAAGGPDRPDGAAWPARAVVTDSQRLLRPVKWRLSCVMRQEDGHDWRLINGRELYDLAPDPGQRTDVAARHGDVVERLRADYESWWDLVSERTGEAVPIPLGEAGAPPGAVCLTAHDWRRDPGAERIEAVAGPGDDARCIWNQALVRQGPATLGYWEVEVARAGPYRVELRRWPREAGLALDAGIPGEPVPYTDAIAAGYGGGRAVPIRRATLRLLPAPDVPPIEATVEVTPGDLAAVFELTLPAGPAHLEASFRGADDLHLGAYYVYVEPLERSGTPVQR